LQSFFPKKRRSSRDSGAARQSVFFAKLSFLRKKHSRGCYSTEFFAKLFSKKASIKPRQRSGATVRFLCQAFFLVKESGREITRKVPPQVRFFTKFRTTTITKK